MVASKWERQLHFRKQVSRTGLLRCHRYIRKDPGSVLVWLRQVLGGCHREG